MTTTVRVTAQPGDDVSVIARFVDGGLVPVTPGVALDATRCRRLGFEGKLASVYEQPSGEGPIEVLVGLGDRDRIDRESFRRAGAAAARAAVRAGSLAIVIDGLELGEGEIGDVAAALVEGALLAVYGFRRYKSESAPGALEILEIVGESADSLESSVASAATIAAAVGLARDLINTPAADCTPTGFAEIATEIATREGLSISVLDEEAIAAERLGGVLGVARGSAEPPRLIRIEYVPESDADVPTVALVGKGITFDSGGLSIKTGSGMMTMKTDMSGAAAVLATLSACRKLGVAVRVVGFMPLTENMPGSRATKPGDVLTTRNGKTIEVLNTDAEGRLVLADALSLAVEERPDAIVDLATLTGACVVALGMQIAGIMGNDDRLIDAIGVASRRAGEATWHLPLPSGYRSHIESEIADMKNIGATGQAGALSAGLLLEEFVGTVPWVHMDIAGPARSDEDKGYRRKGATGFGVKTLIELLGQYEAFGGAVQGRAKGTEVLR